MIRWLIGSVGSAVWSAIIFAMGMMVFFPGDWVKDQIAYQVQTQTNKKMLVHIGEANSSGFMGVSLKDVSLYDSKRGRRKAGQTGTPPRENTLLGTLNAISVSPNITSLFYGQLGANIGVELEVENSEQTSVLVHLRSMSRPTSKTFRRPPPNPDG